MQPRATGRTKNATSRALVEKRKTNGRGPTALAFAVCLFRGFRLGFTQSRSALCPSPPPPPPQFRQPSCVRFTPVSLFRRICNLRQVYRSMVALQVGAVLLAAVPMETRVSGIAQYLQRRSSWEKQVYPDARLGSVPLVPCHSHT